MMLLPIVDIALALKQLSARSHVKITQEINPGHTWVNLYLDGHESEVISDSGDLDNRPTNLFSIGRYVSTSTDLSLSYLLLIRQ